MYVAQNKPKILFVGVCLLAYLFFCVLTLPLFYITRHIVILLAKLLKPDFDEILCGLSAIFSCDLLAKTPLRSTIVVTSVFQNQLLCEQLKNAVQREWIEDNGWAYRKFRQCPVNWLGFCFWKNVAEFCIDEHVHKADCGSGDEELDQFIEKLMNSPFPANKSPWEFQVIEDYRLENELCTANSIVFFRFHHTLADGFSIISAMTKLFDNQIDTPFNFPMPNISPSERRSMIQKLQYFLAFPINALVEGSVLLFYLFTSCPWRVTDKRKKWHQLVARAEPIPLKTIKAIKHSYGVGFTSVLLSAISSAIYKNLEICRDDWEEERDTVLCMNVLPIPFTREEDKMTLTNRAGGVLLDIPKGYYKTPLQRLQAVDKMLKEKKNSIVPYMSQVLPMLAGSLPLSICRVVAYNTIVPFALSNVPGLPRKFKLNGNPIIDNDFQMGGGQGVTGVTISAFSHDENIRLSITVEEGLMSRAQAKKFINSITDEIRILREMQKSN